MELTSRLGFIQRSRGHSVVAAAAYLARVKLYDQQTGQTHDYSRKAGDVGYAAILAPEGAQAWVFDRQKLWNKAEQAERRKDSVTAQSMMFSLPNKLARHDLVAIINRFCQANFVKKGMVVDVALHIDNPNNPHFHLLTTLRELEGDGFAAIKNTSWTSRFFAKQYRRNLAGICNEMLAERGLPDRVNHLSYAERGINKIAGVHIGKSGYMHSEAAQELIALNQSIMAMNYENALSDINEFVFNVLLENNNSFTDQQLKDYVFSISQNKQEYDFLYEHIRSHPETVFVGQKNGEILFSSKKIATLESNLTTLVKEIKQDGHYKISLQPERIQEICQQHSLSLKQTEAVVAACRPEAITTILGASGSGKTHILKPLNEIYKEDGWKVIGLAPTAAESREMQRLGMKAFSVDAVLHHWAAGRHSLHNETVIFLENAAMVDDERMRAIFSVVHDSGAKLIMTANLQQTQVMRKALFIKDFLEKSAAVVLDENHRQTNTVHQHITALLGQGKTLDALHYCYEQKIIQNFSDAATLEQVLLDRLARDLETRDLKELAVVAASGQRVAELNNLIKNFLIDTGRLPAEEGVLVRGWAKPYNTDHLNKDDQKSSDTQQALKEALTQSGNKTNQPEQNDILIEVVEGSRVRLLETNKDIGAYKNAVGTITAIDRDASTMTLKLDYAVSYIPAQEKPIDSALNNQLNPEASQQNDIRPKPFLGRVKDFVLSVAAELIKPEPPQPEPIHTDTITIPFNSIGLAEAYASTAHHLDINKKTYVDLGGGFNPATLEKAFTKHTEGLEVFTTTADRERHYNAIAQRNVKEGALIGKEGLKKFSRGLPKPERDLSKAFNHYWTMNDQQVAWSTAQITEFAQTQSNDQQEQLAIVDRLEKIRAGMLARYDFSPKKAMSNGQLFDRMTALVKTLSDAKQHELTKTFNYFDLKDACSDRGFNDDQSRVAAHLCELESRISSIRGYAGTGKSTVMRFVNEKLTEKGLRLLGVSPTGLGADGLQKSSGIPSDTVHKFLAQLLRGDVTLTPQHVVVVDEAWMVDDRLLLAILENVEKSGASVFCLGDPHQLSAVMPGHIANMVLTEESKAHPQLQKVIRQKDTSAVFANFTDKEFATLKSSGELDERLPAQLFDKVYALEDGQHRQELFTGEELRELRLALGYHNLREKLLNSDREAIELFGQGKGMQALSRLMAVGKINFFNGIKDKSDSFEEAQLPSKNNPIHTLINDWSAKVKEGIPLKDLAIIATTNADVNILNERARAYLVEHGLVERDGVSVDILREVDHFQADFTNTAIEHKAAATAALLALQQNSQKPGDVVDLENDNAQSNQPEQAVEPEPEAQFVNDKIQLAKNDRIVFLKNHKDLDIKNGNRGSIVEIDKEKMAVLFDGEDKARTIHFSEYKWFNHAFAFTVHKSQGQTIPYVFCYFHSYLNAKLTYVGCSRHTVDLKVYVVNAGVDQLLREDSEARRYLRDIQQYQEFKEMLQDCWSKSERSLKNDFTKPMVRTMGYKKSAYGVHDYKVNMHVNEQQKTRESEQKTQLIDMPQETKFKDRSFLGKVWGWLKAEDIKEEYFEKERLALLQEKALEKDLLDKAKEVEQKAYHDNLKAHYGTKATSYHGVEQVLGGVQQQAHDSTNLNNKLEKAFGQELKNMLQECSRQSERSLKNKFNKSMVRTMRYKKSAYGIQDNKFETRLVEQQKLREAQQKTQMLDMPKEIKFKDRSLVGKAWGWLKSDDIKEEIAEAEKLARLQEKAMLDKAKEVEQKAYRDDLKAHYGTKATSYAGAEQTLGVQQVEYTSLSNQLERTLSVKEKDNNLNKEKYNDLNKEKERISDSQQAKEAAAERDLSPEKELLRQQAIAKRHIEQERQLERAQQRELER